MKIETRIYNLDGRRIVEDICPPMWCIVDVYHPCSSTTPWDYHGMRHQREYCKVLQLAGITAISLRTIETKLHPIGSGPRGSIRFGDDMLPGVYKIAVSKYDTERAAIAFAKHKLAIDDWLNNNAPMPEACGY